MSDIIMDCKGSEYKPDVRIKQILTGKTDRNGFSNKAFNFDGISNWIQVQEVASSSPLEPLLLGLDRGELEVILLAISIKPDWVIIDEKLARRVAKAMELPVKGTLGILLVGFYAGYLSKQEILDLSQ
jgi:predicted nucleic acid-binding protein